jgi:hypothetical protein
LATAVGFGLANNPTFGCGGATTAFGGAGGIAGIAGVFSFAISGFGGSGKGFAIWIFGGVVTTTGGAVTWTRGIGGSFAGGGGGGV